ncbi:TIGR03545 family protein [Balneola vulgaris]|uniref:TIGR03545 family protein n=1 Tax=Balneola vulgaris TaxID=287535 RepID=UPI0003761D59|nr:TIGR03545 family protein [Balneola vulgaris]
MRIFRIQGIIAVVVITILSFLISWISIDPIVEERLEYSASVANGALVEIDDFEISLVDLKIRWSRLQVANPENTMENSFETGEAELDFLFWPTLWERVIIEDVIFKEFRMDTERETDGYFEIPEEEKNKEPGFLTKVISDVTSEVSRNANMEFNNIKSDINVDSVLAKLDLQAPEKIDTLRNGLEQNYQKWDSTLTNTDINKEIASVQSSIQKINVKEIKDPKKAIEAIQNVQKLAKQVDSLRNRANQIKSEFQEDFGDTKFSIGRIDNWIEGDYQRAMNMAKLPRLDAQNIAQSLFGENLLADYAGYMEYLAIAREYSSRLAGDDKEKIERYEGIDYEFTDKYDWPKLWIQNIDVSGETKTAIKLAGQIAHISSDQKKTKEPITFNLSGSDDASRKMSLTGEINYLGEEPVESFNFTYDGFSLAGTKLSPSELLPYPMEQGVGEVSASLQIVDKRIDSEINYSAKNLAFNFDAVPSNDRIQQLIKDAVSSTDRIDVTALVDNVDGPLKVRIRSNIDDLFVNALKNTVSKEVDRARQRIEAEVRKEVEGRKEDIIAFKEQKEAEIRKEYEQLEARIQQELQKVEEKKAELEKKKKELEDSLKNKIKDKIGIDWE